MSGDGPLPGGIPERRLDPRDDDESQPRYRGEPAHFTCPCGSRAWVFPRRGVGFCGFCSASIAARGAK